ncbi:NAD-dependent succinate-semialdehyde dehydrogenase [Tamlana agarivorans]|uniref:NAD-dependent succinate-semialdehyde dehydrogenase n=1 Tax=Pseudotamlana agarivorans TaxID=481183 RepID=A0ACC5U4Y6_9FLAO|nr:NAD-dependent succinate-semialdehyde dehydrogenase [Tamlana agarivorans]MBU2949362.1 NAD-dependent succinate-semialdehyde dehydrogenase [Tamlana agarivorans]
MKKDITTTNPYSNEDLESYNYFTSNEISEILLHADKTFQTWKTKGLSKKTGLVKKVADNLWDNRDKYAKLISSEMGKPIKESLAEIDKCMYLCDFYAKTSSDLLADALIETDAQESFISYDPLGVILGVMPWNYPFWQVLRFAIPTLTAGNCVVLKHASNVTGCALAIQDVFEDAGYPMGCFTTIVADHSAIESIIKNDIVKAISLTGSEKAGRKIAEIAGSQLKKLVLELGGNNACIVLNDADLDSHLSTMVNARMLNTGQSCIAAKRFIVEAEIYDTFLEQFTKKVAALKSGDPLLEDTEIGTLARPDLADILEDQVNRSVEQGAHIHYGNARDHAYYQPTIITEVTTNMPVFTEETFGPVAAIIKVSNKEEAYKLASDTSFGLGTMIFTENIEDAKQNIIHIEDGAFFINEMVKSDPRLPFGGTKNSGYGRELSKEGLLAFTNKKTVYIK